MSDIFISSVRTILIIIGLFLLTKILGKKQLSKLSFFEYIAGITVGDIAGSLSLDTALNMKDGITSILIWTAFPVIVSKIALKSKKFRYFVDGVPTTFVKNGKIIKNSLSKEKYSVEDLLEQLRMKNIFYIKDVEFATLEANGELSVLLKKARQPVLVEDIVSDYTSEKEPYTVIIDGEVNAYALKEFGKSENWLQKELSTRGLQIKDIFIAQVDISENWDFYLYNGVKI